ncbi:hypothetical protein E2562_030446 [Oryza meyeriana var. granulata]|uniref:Uncharacterized protein n=1 Tax=Oryza meyeriana var. granulata TaxID=110450 RepID=A0A6G1FEF0_9ORYZ|nr:hypothetical protein E2562_030446 [Oryza meyeriana var. granulata]
MYCSKRLWQDRHRRHYQKCDKKLYLVLDDPEMGYNIYKLDVDKAFNSGTDDEWFRLPKPTALCLEALSRRCEQWYQYWESVHSPLPFDDEELTITAYALHPDGRPIYVSARRDNDDNNHNARRTKKGTYPFDTKHSLWTCHGEWLLAIPWRVVTSCSERVSWLGSKVVKERLLPKDLERHVGEPGATLTYMGKRAQSR